MHICSYIPTEERGSLCTGFYEASEAVLRMTRTFRDRQAGRQGEGPQEKSVVKTEQTRIMHGIYRISAL